MSIKDRLRPAVALSRRLLGWSGIRPAPKHPVPDAFKVVLPGVRVPAVRKGRALLTYICEPFSTASDTPQFRRHANYAQCLSIADELASRGYVVDITHWRNPEPPDGAEYDLIFGLGQAFAIAAARRRKEAKAIYFGTGAVANQTNLMQIRRDVEFDMRHGTQVSSSLHDPDNGPSLADHLLVTGDDWVVGTYAGCSSAPVSVCPNPIVRGVVDTRSGKDFESARRHFLWMAAYGGLRRRLDLVLEAFSRMPDMHLWVCGDLKHEKRFYAAVKPWLSGLDNVHEMGWVDVGGDRYREITARCGFMIYPTVSDGYPGSVINAMASGVVPLATRETGTELGSGGRRILADSVDDIVAAVGAAVAMSPDELARMSSNASEIARSSFTQEHFDNCLRVCFDRVGL